MKLTHLKKKDFEDILSNYNIGKYKKFKHVNFALGNTVYILETTKGKYVMKIFERAKLDYIKYQIKIMNFLNLKKVSVPELVKTKNKKFLLIRNNKRILIQKFIDGQSPKKLSEKLIIDIANIMGLMNKHLLKLKLQGKHIWEKDHEFKHLNFKGVKTKGFDFKEEENKLLKELRKLNRKKLRRGVVHGDCHSCNLLVHNDRVSAIIDWDDVHEDYLVYEISAFMTHSFFMTPLYYGSGRFNRKQIKLFLKKYQKHVKLNQEERKAIYYFIKQRFLQIIEWQSRQMKTHKDLTKKLKQEQFRRIRQYQFLNKISLEKFLGLFEK